MVNLFFRMFCVRNMGKPDLDLLFRNLNELGLPKSQFSIINDEYAYKYNPDRYNFYMQLLDDVSDPKQKVATKVFGVLARTRRQHERIKEKIDTIASAINYLKSSYTKPANVGDPREYGELAVLKNDLNSKLKRKPIIGKEYEFDTDLEKIPVPEPVIDNLNKEFQKAMGTVNQAPIIDETKPTPGQLNVPSQAGGGYCEQDGGSYFSDKKKEFEDLDKVVDSDKTKSDKDKKFKMRRDREMAEDDIILEYKNHPLYSPENQKVTYTDRLVFIGVTYVFRLVSLYMIEWGLNTKIIRSFHSGFLAYFAVYSLLFIIWVLLVNIPKNNLLVSMLFYYINANYDKSVYKRAIVHLVIVSLILIVPLIVVDTPKTDGTDTDTFDKKVRMNDTLNLFTLVIWIMTSAAALTM